MNVAKSNQLSKILAAAAIGLGFASAAPAAEINPWDGAWHYDLTLYAWLPKVDADISVRVPLTGTVASGNAEVSPSGYLSALQFAGMAGGQARKGNVALFTDIDYVDFAHLNSRVKDVSLPGGRVSLPLNEDLNVEYKALVWTAAASYTVARSDAGTLDVAAGVRYLASRASLDWNYSSPNGVLGRSGSASDDVNLWDGIVGAYGTVRLADRWFIPYYVDIGAGNHSNWTTMAYAGVGYEFDWGRLMLIYKNLYYKQNSGEPLEHLNLGGAALAVGFRW